MSMYVKLKANLIPFILKKKVVALPRNRLRVLLQDVRFRKKGIR